VLGSRWNPLVCPHHVGDLHQVVVDDVGQVIGGEAVTLEQHLVVELGVVEGHRAADRVNPLGSPLGDALAQHRRHAPGALAGDLLLPAQAAPVVAAGLVGRISASRSAVQVHQ